MGRIKGALEKPRVNYDMRPKNWLETIPIVLFSKGESRHSGENLRRMYEYLRKYKVQAKWYTVNCDGEMVLLALIDSQRLERI